jgi:hypothetical protein
MKIRRLSEALATKCQTPDMVYDISIQKDEITIGLKLPFELELGTQEATLLEKNLHNSIEQVMKVYFKDDI